MFSEDEIIEMARDAWKEAGEGWVDKNWFEDRAKALKAFAKLVDAKATAKAVEREREACAKVCDEAATYQKKYLNTHAQGVAHGCALTIRARGEPTSRGKE